jgi:hypothetical protein
VSGEGNSPTVFHVVKNLMVYNGLPCAYRKFAIGGAIDCFNWTRKLSESYCTMPRLDKIEPIVFSKNFAPKLGLKEVTMPNEPHQKIRRKISQALIFAMVLTTVL